MSKSGGICRIQKIKNRNKPPSHLSQWDVKGCCCRIPHRGAKVFGDVQETTHHIMSSGTPVMVAYEVIRPIVEWQLTPHRQWSNLQAVSISDQTHNPACKLLLGQGLTSMSLHNTTNQKAIYLSKRCCGSEICLKSVTCSEIHGCWGTQPIRIWIRNTVYEPCRRTYSPFDWMSLYL